MQILHLFISLLIYYCSLLPFKFIYCTCHLPPVQFFYLVLSFLPSYLILICPSCCCYCKLSHPFCIYCILSYLSHLVILPYTVHLVLPSLLTVSCLVSAAQLLHSLVFHAHLLDPALSHPSFIPSHLISLIYCILSSSSSSITAFCLLFPFSHCILSYLFHSTSFYLVPLVIASCQISPVQSRFWIDVLFILYKENNSYFIHISLLNFPQATTHI